MIDQARMVRNVFSSSLRSSMVSNPLTNFHRIRLRLFDYFAEELLGGNKMAASRACVRMSSKSTDLWLAAMGQGTNVCEHHR